MNKTIVLEPFSEWSLVIGGSPYLVRKSDRHEIEIIFRDETLYVRLLDHGNTRTINSRHVSALAEVVQFVDKYIDQHYITPGQVTRLLEEAANREKFLQKQIAEFQASVGPY